MELKEKMERDKREKKLKFDLLLKQKVEIEERKKKENELLYKSDYMGHIESNSDEEQGADSELSKEIKERVQEHVGNWGLISELTEEQYRKKRQAIVEEVITRKSWMKK